MFFYPTWLWAKVFAFFAVVFLASARAEEVVRPTGLIKPNAEQTQWAKNNLKTLGQIKPEQLSNLRLQQEQNARDVQSRTVGTPSLPSYVDNSLLDCFPPIRDQGAQNSCVGFAAAYYLGTHMTGLIRGWNVKNDADNSNKFSPKWVYNFINSGEDNGSNIFNGYQIILKHGAAVWSDFPYDGDNANPLNFREWPVTANVWRNAINFRMAEVGQIVNLDKSNGINSLKQSLANGWVLNFCTYVNSWQWLQIADDPAEADDGPLVGQWVCAYVNGSNGPHSMTVVGYDDRLWVDLNSNGLVDDGEKGAFKVANSWGSGWRQNGFAWFAYDALKAVSAVSGAPADGRVEGWWDRTAYWMTAKAEYAPKLTAEFTLNHAKRNQLYVTLGVSNTNQTSPTSTWEPPAFFYRGGAHAFDGGASAVDGVFVLDFTDIAPPPATAKRFHVGVYDDGSGESAVLKTYKLTDVYGGGTEKNAVNVPQTVENGQIYAWVDHNRSTPDLTVLSLTHSPEYPSPGSLVTFTATIWNKGTVIAPACRVGFWSYLLGEPLLTTTPEIEKSVPAIAAGLTAEVTFSLTAPAAGSRRAWVFVDRKQGVGEVEESNETNNAGPSGGHPWGVNGAPVISSGPTVSPNPVSVGRMASFSVVANDPENGILTGVWNFGDGQTDSGLAVEHAYANAGTYAAQVTVSDDKGAATQGSVLVIVTTNTAPVLLAPPTATPPQAWREQTILFSAAATDAENDPLTFAWDFGDGNSAVGASVEHRYANGGTYVVSVVVSDPSNAFDRKELTVIVGDNAPPQITLGPQATPQPTGVGGELSFWVQATDPDGGAVTITWDFGDGATALGSAVKHAYSVAGAYVVTVRVADAGGAEIASTLSVEILANWDAPSLVSAPTARPNPVKPGAPVLFSATTNAPGTTYAAWDFGDGSSAPGVCAVHSFTQTGVYVVKFLAADDQGRQTFASLCVAVENSDDAGESETAKATKTQLKVGFAKKGRDAVSISGVINIPKNFSPAGLTADVSLGDVERSFILDAKGRGAVGRNDKFQISFKSVKKVIQPGPAKFSLSLKNGDFRSAWEKWGLADADVSKRILRLPLLLQAGELSYVGTIDVTYSAKAGKAGSGR